MNPSKTTDRGSIQRNSRGMAAILFFRAAALALALLASPVLLINQACAATFTWSGSSNDYTSTSSWVGGVAPTTTVTTNDINIVGNTNVSTILTVANVSLYIKSLTFAANNTVDTKWVLAGADTTGANTRPLVFSSDTGTATLTVSGDGNKTINRTQRPPTAEQTPCPSRVI